MPDGAVVARLSINGAEFWLADESPKHGNFSPESLKGGSVRMMLTVADPDAVFARTLAAGASKVFPVGEGHGWRPGSYRRSLRPSLGNRPATHRLVTYVGA